MNLNSLDIENNMLPKHSQKPFSLYKFFSKHFSASFCIVSKNNICTAQFLKHSESKYLYISVYLPKKVFIPKMQ